MSFNSNNFVRFFSAISPLDYLLFSDDVLRCIIWASFFFRSITIKLRMAINIESGRVYARWKTPKTAHCELVVVVFVAKFFLSLQCRSLCCYSRARLCFFSKQQEKNTNGNSFFVRRSNYNNKSSKPWTTLHLLHARSWIYFREKITEQLRLFTWIETGGLSVWYLAA